MFGPSRDTPGRREMPFHAARRLRAERGPDTQRAMSGRSGQTGASENSPTRTDEINTFPAHHPCSAA